jgi:hypothetical protein
MAKSRETKPKVTKIKEKKTTQKAIKKNDPAIKRGQPTAAARLVSSSYVKYGWHKPLSGEIKGVVQKVSPVADSMYMLQIRRDRPIDALSLRNGIFWEHRQLADQGVVSTPAADHLDLFSSDEESFEDTLKKIGKQVESPRQLLLHYLFEGMREREFLILPVVIDGAWVTVIARIRPKTSPKIDAEGGRTYVDREVTDFAIVDPVVDDRAGHRREFVSERLASILNEGCIHLSPEANLHNIGLASVEHSWQTGLVAYAISREFLRRLKTLIWRRARSDNADEAELWADFEEDYNFDAYRQCLMSSCAHQCIEKSGYRIRLALEVPSDESEYQHDLIRRQKAAGDLPDEKWDFFEEETHTHAVQILVDLPDPTDPPTSSQCSPASAMEDRNPLPLSPGQPASPTSPTYSFVSPIYSPISPAQSPSFLPKNSPVSRPYGKHGNTESIQLQINPAENEPLFPKGISHIRPEVEDTEMSDAASDAEEAELGADIAPGEINTPDEEGPDTVTNSPQNAPVAPMGEAGSLSRIPGLSFIAADSRRSPLSQPTEDQPTLLQPRQSCVLVAVTPTGGLSPPPRAPDDEEERILIISAAQENEEPEPHGIEAPEEGNLSVEQSQSQSQSLAAAALKSMEPGFQEPSLKRPLDLDENCSDEEGPSLKRQRSGDGSDEDAPSRKRQKSEDESLFM